MKKKLLALLITGSCLLAGAQTALIPDMKFRRLDSQDGLSSSQTNCIFQDSRGFIWIGTPYGLNRYDGYRVKTYYSNIRDTTSIRDNYVDRIFEAWDGKLWIKSGMNYCVFDPVTETCERNAMRALEKLVGHSGGIEKLFIDSKKNFWIKFYEEPMLFFNPKTKKQVRFKQGYNPGEVNPTYGICSFAEYGDKLVISTFNGELVCLDPEKGEVSWEDKYMRMSGGPENQDYHLVIDNDSNYWCTALDYSYVYSRKEDRWYSTVTEYMTAQGITGLPETLQIWGVLIGSEGWVWLICDHEGVIVCDLKTKQAKQFLSSKHDQTTISDNTPRQIYEDNHGRIWIGTYKNGLNEYVRGMENLKNIDEVGDINTVCEDRYGNYWLGSNDSGIIVYDPKTGQVVNHFTKDNSGLANNIMVGSWPASDGSIWFGSYNGGLSRCIPSADNPTQATIVNYQATGDPEGLANNSVWALTEDKWKRIWMTTLGGGLQMLDPKTGKFTTWNTKNTQLPSDYMTSIGWTKKGWLIAGTSYYYALTNPVSKKLNTKVLPENPDITVNTSSTNYVIEDSRGLIWQGSSSGLTVYDEKTKFIDLIDMYDGLIGSSINAIAEDKQHAIWAVTDHGVSRIVPEKQDDGTWQFNVRSFSSRDGLMKGTYNQRSTWVTRDGLLLVGGQGGIDIINPANLQERKSNERVIFSGLQLFDQDVAAGEKVDGRVILTEALDFCREINLRYDDQFTIQLATNQVDINNSKRFAYMLEGFNKNWVKTSEQNPNITYNSLRAGSYTLHVRILNEDGTLGEEESTLEITITPPLWRTRWMLLLYMVIIAAAALLWRRRFIQKQKERAELEKLRLETRKRQWMSEMRAQLIKEGFARQEQAATDESPVEVIDEKDIIVEGITETPPVNAEPLSIHRTEGDFAAFLKDCCDNFKWPEGKRGRIMFNSQQESITMAYDADLMGKAVSILLTNAANFSPLGSKIQVTLIQPNSERIVMLVADNGIGVPPEAKEHLFAPMMGDEEGIGLDTVKQIVDAHHGEIKGEDNPGGGTVITISLPIEDPDIEEATIIEDKETV